MCRVGIVSAHNHRSNDMQFTINDNNVQTIATALGLHGKVKTDDMQEIFQAWIDEAISEKFLRTIKASKTAASNEQFVAIGLMIYEYLKGENPRSYTRLASSRIEQMIPDMPDVLRSLLNWENAVGTCLGHLAKRHPELVRKGRTATTRFWKFTY